MGNFILKTVLEITQNKQRNTLIFQLKNFSVKNNNAIKFKYAILNTFIKL